MNLHEYVREVLELGDYLEDGNLLAAELYTEFHCFKDSPASTGLPLLHLPFSHYPESFLIPMRY
jgi:hypothetical protein